jgi:hypothetical protein
VPKIENNPYFALFHGAKVSLTELTIKVPYTLPAVKAMVEGGHMVGQITLPDPETGQSDTVLYMPKHVEERRIEIETRLASLRAELNSLK